MVSLARCRRVLGLSPEPGAARRGRQADLHGAERCGLAGDQDDVVQTGAVERLSGVLTAKRARREAALIQPQSTRRKTWTFQFAKTTRLMAGRVEQSAATSMFVAMATPSRLPRTML